MEHLSPLNQIAYEQSKSKIIQLEKLEIFFLHLQKLEIFFFYVGTSKILDPAAKRLREAVKVGQLFAPRHSCENLVSYCSLLDLIKRP